MIAQAYGGRLQLKAVVDHRFRAGRARFFLFSTPRSLPASGRAPTPAAATASTEQRGGADEVVQAESPIDGSLQKKKRGTDT